MFISFHNQQPEKTRNIIILASPEGNMTSLTTQKLHSLGLSSMTRKCTCAHILGHSAGPVPLIRLWLRHLSVAQRLKRLPPMRETRVRSLGREDPLEKEMAIHSGILAWRIPWTEKPSRSSWIAWRRQVPGCHCPSPGRGVTPMVD